MVRKESRELARLAELRVANVSDLNTYLCFFCMRKTRERLSGQITEKKIYIEFH